MQDDYETTFIVELATAEVWEALTRQPLHAEGEAAEEKHYVLPGFPSFVPRKETGSSCTVLEEEVGRLLRVRKDDEPCAGTEIAVTLESTKTGTRITVVQSGFGAFLDIVGRDTVFGHGDQIMKDFRLYLERGLSVPGTVWGPGLGARIKQTPVGLEMAAVDPGGFAERLGLSTGDLLLTLGAIRVHDLQQLWTVLALTEVGSKLEVTWARGRESMSGGGAIGI